MPDWADILAAQWMDSIKATYSEKGLGNDKIYAPIVNIQGQAFATGINGIYNDVDFDTPDWYMREVLKRNTWQFSVAKNYNDSIAINNALIDENGALRSWNDFKKEAQKIAGDSVKYLKTEYNTVVASAQMSRLYNDIQRDKAIFPLAQFVVVKDGRTSDICSPLDGVTVSVDDPILAYYFPPNHFNCRTTVKRLRRGKITDEYQKPDIPEAFRNNTGVTGEIFTKDNAYISNTPDEVLKLSDRFHDTQKVLDRYSTNANYYDVESNSLNGLKATHKRHNFDPHTGKYEKDVLNIMFEKGNHIVLEDESDGSKKKPDGILNEKSFDLSTILGDGKNTIKRALNHSREKNAELAVLYFPDESLFSLKRITDGVKMYQGQTKYRFKNIIYIVNGEIHYL